MFTFIFWDWKEQLPVTELRDALNAVFEPESGRMPVMMDYDDDSDTYHLLISSRELSQEEQDAAYEIWLDGANESVENTWGAGPIPDSVLADYIAAQA